MRLKRVKLLQEGAQEGDGWRKPAVGRGCIDVDRIVYLEDQGYSQGMPLTCVHLDDGSLVDVLASVQEIMDLV